MAKIAIYNVTNTLKRGGVETCLWEVARKFNQWGHRVTVFGGQGSVRPAGGVEGIEVRTYPYTHRDRIINLGSRFKKIGERVSFARNALPDLIAGRFDAIILGKPYDIPAALLVRARSGARVAYFSGGGEFFPGYGQLARRLDYFAACSQHDSDDIFAHCGVRPDPNRYGVDTELFRPLPPDAELARSLGLDPAGPVMASAVRLVAFKGLDYGLRAVGIIKERLPGIRYLIAGTGPQEGRLREMVQAMGLGEQVVFVGELDHAQLPSFYSLADVAVFPSFMETFGIAVGEAMACGVPVVATEVGGIPEQVKPGCGLLVPPKDETALAGAVLEALRGGQAAAMGARARETAVELLDWSRCARRLLEGVLGKGAA